MGCNAVVRLLHCVSGPPALSQHYFFLLTFTVEHLGLWSDSLEPCVYGGQIVKDGHELGFCLCVVYVDDILLLSTTKEAEEHVVATLSSVVPVKTTGEIGEEG